MTKYGHEHGAIAKSQLETWVMIKTMFQRRLSKYVYFPNLHNSFRHLILLVKLILPISSEVIFRNDGTKGHFFNKIWHYFA